MTPEEELELLQLEKEKRRRANLAKQGEGETGEDDGEGEDSAESDGTMFDAIQGGTRGVTLGLNDVVAGLGAAAGDLYQSTVDSRPRNPNAYAEGVAGERERDAASRERSPNAYGRAQLAGLLATAPLLAAKPVQVAARAASGAPVAATAIADAAAPALARYSRAAGSGALSALGFGDVDKPEDVPVEAAKGAVLGAGGEALSSLVRTGAASGDLGAALEAAKARLSTLAPSARAAAADALEAVAKAGGATPLIKKKFDEIVARAAAAGADKVRGAQPAAPKKTAPTFERAATDPLDEMMAAGTSTKAPPAPPVAPLAPTPKPAPPPAPADALDELATARMAPASQALPEQMTSVVPVVTKNSSAGNIAKAVEAKAIELGTTDLATIANALKLPTGLVSDPLKNAVSRFAFREAVKGASKAPVVPAAAPRGDALAEMASEGQQMPMEALAAIRQAKIETPRSLLPGDRPMAQVAAANQGAEMAAAYQALSPEQRPVWVNMLRQQGYDDEKIRLMLGITKKNWRQTSMNR
jgi:hypothetical protein